MTGFDSGSPLGARWFSEHECDDQFALDVVAAIDAMLQPVARVQWPEPPAPEIDSVLMGVGRSPSVVWHSQAAGALLELGFFPSAPCVRRHLLVLKERLRPEMSAPPAGRDDPPWVLRTRHVAWVLACLAEMPRVDEREAR